MPQNLNFTIVADRQFGNQRFMNLVSGVGFSFVLRAKGSIFVSKNGKSKKLSQFTQKLNRNCGCKNRKINVVISEKNNEKWYLLTDLNELRGVGKIYERRFWTEEYFRDLKTYFGTRKINYSHEKMKRVLFLGIICYNFIFKIGVVEKIDTSRHSSSGVSFFPAGILVDSFKLQKISKILQSNDPESARVYR